MHAGLEQSFTGRMQRVIEELKCTSIDGCITGSCLITNDYENWQDKPDIDIFVYSEVALVHAVDVCEYLLDFKAGKREASSVLGEEWKLNRIRRKGMQKNNFLATVSMKRDDIVVNITLKKNQTTMVDVLSHFDMSIVMVGYDILSQYELDLRGPKPNLAEPNKLRNQDAELYSTAQWVRQFDRVIKYWNRGYDTRPMAHFYIDLIESVIDTGALFTTEKSKEAYDLFVEEFTETKKKIAKWIAEREDD
jgi:hypothetical protein